MVVKYLQLNDISCYKRAFRLSNYVWNIIISWEWFAKRTLEESSLREQQIQYLPI